MDAERWGRVDQLLQSALEVSPEQRDEFLRRESAGDAALEAEVRSLLDSHRNADGFLERPAIRVAAKAMAQADTGDAVDSMCGRMFSHYRILKKLGAVAWARFIARKTLALTVRSQSRPFCWMAFLNRTPYRDLNKKLAPRARSTIQTSSRFMNLGQVNGTHYIAMELVDGPTVRETSRLWPDSISQGGRHRGADCRRSGQSTRNWHCSS